MLCLIILSLSAVSASNETDTGILQNSQDSDNNIAIALGNSSIVDAQQSRTIEITQDSYNDYFNQYTGEIKSDADIKSGDVIKIGNISNRAFVIDRQLTLMPISPGDVISNGFIHLVKGSDYSTVTNLTINNTKGILTINTQDVGLLHGIWLSDTNNVNIFNNIIRIANSGGVYAIPMHNSNNNNISYNDMKTWISSNIIMADSNYNVISHNTIEVLSYSDSSVTNLIYFSPFAFAGRLGSSLCLGNTITYNNLIGFSTMPMSIIIQAIYDNNINTTVAHNRIYKGSYGINLYGDNSFVYNNTVDNSAIGIVTRGSNISIVNNTVSGLSQKTGIMIVGSENSNDIATGNNITFRDVSEAMIVGNYANVYNNIINVADYGVGISITGNNSYVHNNKIKTSIDDAIKFLANNNLIDDNIIITNARGVSITTSNENRYYNNTISRNKITSDSYGIFLKGLVYNTTISSNVIETNASVGIYKDITDELSNSNADNMINGVIYDATALIIDDNNFYEYFDENGYLNYTFGKGKSNSLIFTFISNKNIFLDEKVNVISNKMDNLLFNVSINFLSGSAGSLIRDFNFINYNKNAIILNDVDNVNVVANNITEIFTKGSSDTSAIFIVGVGDSNIISKNNIYINSNTDYSYAISASSYNPYTYIYNKEFSKGLIISNNNIIMISKAMAEAIFSDAFVDSEITGNNINIISDGAAYGIAGVNVIGRLYNWNVSNNEIVIHSKNMAYLIEAHMFDNMTIENNYLYSQSNGSYGIAAYMSNAILIDNNEIIINAGNLSNIKDNADVITEGNAAICISGLNELINITGNIINTNTSTPIIIDNSDSIVDIADNGHVLSDYNFNVYFDENNIIRDNVIYNDDALLLANLTQKQQMNINKTIQLLSYKNYAASVLLNITNCSYLSIINMSFYNSTLCLKDVFNVKIISTVFNNSQVNIDGGFGNYLINNTFSGDSGMLKLIRTSDDIIQSNKFNLNSSGESEIIFIDNSHNISILNNNITGIADDLKVIVLSNSNNNNIKGNDINAEALNLFGIYISNSTHNNMASNRILLAGKSIITNQSAILLTDKSSNNDILDNFIISSSLNGGDYAITILSNENLSNIIKLNYLISDNGDKRANDAVYSLYDLVDSNTPYIIYVSDDGSDIAGNGSEENPYSSIAFALSKALNHAVIKVVKGTFIESNLIIDKNITISAVNPGDVVVNANSQQLFTILPEGSLTVNGVVFKNGFDVNGGALFKNNGSLFINNSVLANSSSYFDNSHPVFDHDVSENSANTINCTKMGMGGAILNHGELFINDSYVYGNFAHIGGAIADLGKTIINASTISSNQAVHGGAIYTNSQGSMIIYNSSFYDNIAIISLDYCMVHKAVSSWSIDDGYHYTYSSLCGIPMGAGGAIFSSNTDLIINNTSFIKNHAWKGGAIATNFVSSSSKVDLPVSLILNDCYFENNRANNTIPDSSNLTNSYPYNNGYEGGAIYGAFKTFHALGTDFISNQAAIDSGFSGSGGALKVQSGDGVIDLCKFIGNRAGITGGALDISNNFIITRTIISNNSAMYGGAINYQSYSYYGHVQDNLNIYNSTITDNMALKSGGAFRIGQSNVTVRNSNIYNNFAPEGTTMSASYLGAGPDKISADMRYNFWGTNEFGKVLTADNSVYNFPNVITGKKSNTKFIWTEVDENKDDGGNVEPIIPVNPVNPNDNPGSIIVNPAITNPISGTGSQIGSGGNNGINSNGNGGIAPNGNKPHSGNNPGNGDGEKWGDGGSNSDYSANESRIDASSTFNVPSNHQTSSDENQQNSDNSGSQSTVDTTGMSESNIIMVNNTDYGDSSTSDDASESGTESSSSSSSSDSSSSAKAFEVKENTVKDIDNNVSIFVVLAVIIVVLALFIIGYKREENDDEY